MTSPGEVLRAATDRWGRRWASAQDVGRAIHLVSCATTDITQPYHSFSYLAGALNRSGHRYIVRDLGIEFWRYIISPPVVAELQRVCRTSFTAAAGDARVLLHTYADRLEDASRFERAWTVLRDRDRFFDVSAYLGAVRELTVLPRLLTLLSRSAVYRTFSSMSPSGSEEDRINLVTFRREIERGFGIEVLDYFYDFHAGELARQDPLLVGLTIPFLSQLEHSFALGRRLRDCGIDVAIGGPIAAKFQKYSADVRNLRVLSFGANLLVAGEGESLLPRLADRLAAGGPLGDLPNLVDLEEPVPLERIHFENVDALPPPDYSLWDYDLYASPEPGALYSPTRGCYWNKCSFCDYGLAVDGPTSPWRTRSPMRVVSDLREASRYARYFFFAVDVLSPSYALKLSREMIEQDLAVRWMADFRLEASFDASSVDVFRRAGCLGAAFGMESTEQAVIDLMKKGTRVDRLEEIVGAFSDAGIAVQLMGFLGFPGERRDQAEATLAKAAKLSLRAATVALGRFGLTPGSDVARKPEEYGVEVVYEHQEDASIPWELKWRHRDPSSDAGASDDLSRSLRLVRGFPFPFLGATTTLHSLLYFERQPKPPFPIPQWSFDFEEKAAFAVIPFYHASATAEGEMLVESVLTGRALVPAQRLAAALDAYFADAAWPVRRRNDLSDSERTFLDLLVEHSLALFLPLSADA